METKSVSFLAEKGHVRGIGLRCPFPQGDGTLTGMGGEVIVSPVSVRVEGKDR